MTYRVLEPWVEEIVLLGMPLHERVRYVRTNLASPRKGSRDPWMSQEDFAEAVGASDRAVANRWERDGDGRASTPRSYAKKIAALTPYPPEAFGADGEAELVRRSLGTRLEALEATAAQAEDILRLERVLTEAIRSLASGDVEAALRALPAREGP